MVQLIQPLTKHLNLVIFFLAFGLISNAQIETSYSIGGLKFENANKIAFSGPIIIDSKKCFNIFNGIEQFSKVKTGSFVSACSIKSITGFSINVNSFPNPFNDYLFVSIDNQISDFSNEKILIELISAEGKKVYSKSYVYSDYKNTIKIFTSNLSPGSYLLGVKSNQSKTEYIKLIKF